MAIFLLHLQRHWGFFLIFSLVWQVQDSSSSPLFSGRGRLNSDDAADWWWAVLEDQAAAAAAEAAPTSRSLENEWLQIGGNREDGFRHDSNDIKAPPPDLLDLSSATIESDAPLFNEFAVSHDEPDTPSLHEERSDHQVDKRLEVSRKSPVRVYHRLMKNKKQSARQWKRSANCLRRCMAQGLLHPAQCHSLC